MGTMFLIELQKIAIAFFVGAIIGIEREYRSKPAGFRTMIMICVGSALFTILSKQVSDISPDRIASNIVTGIGFIGAGVIFKEGININGLTTAALIWVTAALGMAAGYGNYLMVIIVSLVVLFTLFILEYFQRTVDKLHKVSVYKIKFLHQYYSQEQLEASLSKVQIKYNAINIAKDDDTLIITYRIVANNKGYLLLNKFLVETESIKNFTV
jgi:putative Mg2+ transporter-C (MgtC) family protein